LLLVALSVRAETINFDKDKAGEAPAGWTSGVTGDGASKWEVVAEVTAPSKPNALKQSAEGKYPWCVKKDISIKDGFVEVKFKPVSGKDDQAAGIVWRFKDGNNYYVARANALEDNVSIYFTKDGKRNTLKYQDAKFDHSAWNTLRVDFKASKFTVSLNGAKVIEIEDANFADAGAIGLWTKADSVTLFDDFTWEGK
jgi:hypothetical protein